MINSVDILRKIVTINLNIENLTFHEFESYKLIQERINLNENPLDIVFSEALELREIHHLPFWDSFNVSLFGKKIENYSFLGEINFHNNPVEKKVVNRHNLIEGAIIFDSYTGVISKLNSELSELHLPLLDFHIPVSKENQKICSNIIQHLNLKGYLLDSGKSYHFIGNELMNYECLQNVLFNSLLFAPIIDKSWVAHQLIQKYCCLRVSKKYGRSPLLVEEIL